MTHDIAFLHTSEVHISTFSKLLNELEPSLKGRHDVSEVLLADAREQGLSNSIIKRIEQAIVDAASSGAKLVVCTCSTIGSVAETFRSNDFTTMRIDRAMANEAVELGERILVLAALESTLGATRELIEASAKTLGKSPKLDVLHIADAWQHFEANDMSAYFETIARALKANADNYDVLVLAQASMARAADLCTELSIPILSSPTLGVKAAIAKLKEA